MKTKFALTSSITGTINISVKNTKTGKVIKYPEMHNLITKNFARAMMQSNSGHSSSGAAYSPWPSMYLRCGSGSTQPTVDDESLSNDWVGTWYSGSGIARNEAYLKLNSTNNLQLVYMFVLPAEASYVGRLSEVGLYCSLSGVYKNNNSWNYKTVGLITHSLLRDAENNPYYIDKTALDQVTVEYTINFNTTDIAINFFAALATANYPIQNNPGKTKEYFFRAEAMRYIISWYNRGDDPHFIHLLTQYFNMKLIGDYWYLSATKLNLDGAEYYDYYRTVPSSAIPQGPSYSAVCDDNGNLVIPPVRIPALSAANGRYIIGLDFYIRNALIPIYDKNLLGFNVQTLEDYNVGTGDGTTTNFNPPLDYWKRGTEKIYVDNVLQTRGVDYTCDNFFNGYDDPTFFPFRHAVVIDADWHDICTPADAADLPYTAGYYMCPSKTENYIGASPKPLKQIYDRNGSLYTTAPYPYGPNTMRFKNDPITIDNSSYLTATNKKLPKTHFGYLSTNHPLVYELPIDKDIIPWNVNSVYLFCASSNQNFTFSVYYSDDNVIWTNVCDHVTGYKNGRASSTPWYTYLTDWCEYSIGADVIKRYWKIEVHWAGSMPSSPQFTYFGFTIKHKGTPIVFTNPPAAGSVITMDADTDILYKDEKHVIDIGATISV